MKKPASHPYPGSIITPAPKTRKPLLPWYVILFCGIVLGYLLGLVQQASQQRHRQECAPCRLVLEEAAE